MNQAPGKPPGPVLPRTAAIARVGVERRRDRRYPCRIRLALFRNGLELEAWTEDVSFAGIFFRTDAQLPERQLVRLKLTLPSEGEPLALVGMVSRSVPAGRGQPPGVGIQFYSLAPAERGRWNAFIRQVMEGLPSAGAPTVAIAPEPVRRAYPRYVAALQVLLHSVDDLQLLYTRNISKGGLFVATALDVAEGTTMKVSVVHPRTNEQFAFEAVVRRRAAGPEPGIGLEFVGLTEARRDEFLEFVRSEIPVEEVEYVSEGDRLQARQLPAGATEPVDLFDLDEAPDADP